MQLTGKQAGDKQNDENPAVWVGWEEWFQVETAETNKREARLYDGWGKGLRTYGDSGK